MECKCKTTYSSTIQELIVNIRSNIHLTILDSLDSMIIKICTKYKQNKSHKLNQTFSNPQQILMIIINGCDNNIRKLHKVMCISDAIKMDRYQANLKAAI